MSSGHILLLQEIHLVVTHVQLLLQSTDNCRTRIHLLPNSKLQDHFGLDKPTARRRLLFLVDHTANNLSPEAMDELFFCKFVHSRNVQLMVVSSSDFVEFSEIVIFHEVVVGFIKPLSFLHLLKTVTVLVGIMLDYRFHLPQLRSLTIWFIP